MIAQARSLARFPMWIYRALALAARALGSGLLLRAWRRTSAVALDASGPLAPAAPVTSRAELRASGAHRAPTEPAMSRAEPGTRPAQLAPAKPATRPVPPADARTTPRAGNADRLALPDVERVEVESEFNAERYPGVLQRLQLGPRSKLLDLRAAKLVKVDLFDHLASAWRAPPGTVPRLGILLGYESWVVYRSVAARRLQQLVKQKGVEVEIFYEQQADSLAAWFADGRMSYDQAPAVVEWLRTQWRPTAIWPQVLSTTAMLVHASAHIDQVPELLLELAAIALSFEGAEAGEEAAKHARAALTWVGDKPAAARCRALRALASAAQRRGDRVAALAHLETAIATAVVIEDRMEEASALSEVGIHALQCGQFARAEARFRTAILRLSGDDSRSYLRATLHHDLALALHEQHKDDDAERHATIALELRWDRDSQRAGEDRALLARIRARRPSRFR